VGVSGFHTGFHVLTSSGFSEIFRLSSGALRSLVSVRTSFLVGTQKPETRGSQVNFRFFQLLGIMQQAWVRKLWGLKIWGITEKKRG